MRFFYPSAILSLLVSFVFPHYSEIERNQRLKTLISNDFAKIPATDLQWLNEQAFSAKEFEKRIVKVKTAKYISRLNSISQYLIKPNLVGSSKENRFKNIHKAPFDETRTLRDIPNFYISASDVLTANQAYIVGEEPTDATLSAFWQTVLHTNVQTIVALCTPTPYISDSRYPRSIDGWIISKISEEIIAKSPFIPTQKIVKRVFWATMNTQKRIVTHLHLVDWPDHGAAEGSIFNYLLSYVEYINPDGSSPIFVHCAAGIGRSGTFVAAHSIYKDISACTSKKNLQINIPMRIIEMRIQRKKMLSRDVQLFAVINSIREKMRGLIITARKAERANL